MMSKSGNFCFVNAEQHHGLNARCSASRVFSATTKYCPWFTQVAMLLKLAYETRLVRQHFTETEPVGR